MTPTRLVAALVGLSLASCTHQAPAPEAPPQAQTPPMQAAAPVPPPVELPAPPELPAVPLGLVEVRQPEDNPTTPEKAALGHLLFFEPRMSKDGSTGCVACHLIEKAYTSGRAVDTKVSGVVNTRNAPTMVNIGFHSTFYWDGRMPTLEAVSNASWKGQLGADPQVVAATLNGVPEYKALFQRAFGEDATADNIPKALAAWLRTLQSGDSAWDRARAGDANAMTADAKAGERLFSSKGCVTCHVPPLFSDFDFHNVGIGQDPGRKDATKDDADFGRFKTPSLRDVELTGPYFHDGSAATLDDAIALMAKGGVKNPHLDAKLKPQKLSKSEAAQLKAFLESLTGELTYAAVPSLP